VFKIAKGFLEAWIPVSLTVMDVRDVSEGRFGSTVERVRDLVFKRSDRTPPLPKEVARGTHVSQRRTGC